MNASVINRTVILLAVALASGALAQNREDVPLLRPAEKAAIDAQATQFNAALAPALKDAAKSTVRIYCGRQRLAYGTVIGKGLQVLTKWSQVSAVASESLIVENGAGLLYPAAVTGIYPDEDLVVLDISGEPLTPVAWSDHPLALGSFLAAPQPDGRLAGFGVLAVMERNLRETDQAFLGVIGDIGYKGSGVKVREVAKGAGAEQAGIRVGDVIRRVGQREVSGLMELRNALIGCQPGGRIELTIERDGKSSTLEVTLGNRPETPDFMTGRLAQMERMGTDVSKVRDVFSNAIQTDMNIQPDQIGGPVVDLKGDVVGITVARADRTRSFVMSATAVRDLLAKPSMDLKSARAHEREQLAARRKQQEEQMARLQQQEQANPRAQRPRPRRQMDQEQLEERVAEMRRMMRFLQREMEELEGGK